MYLNIEELKNNSPNTIRMGEYPSILPQDDPLIVFRNYNEPTIPPCFQDNIKVFNVEDHVSKNTSNSYGTKPNIPALNVINAIKSALGSNSYCLHISDGSYTGYSIREVNEYLKNFDNTNLRVWIAETFDCDNFSQVLQGNMNSFFPGISLGTIWYGPKNPNDNWGHSVNIFYDYETNKVLLIEPQSDVFYEFNKELWQAWMVII